MYKRFVDDITPALVSLDPGVRFDQTKMKMVKSEELVESDKDIPEDVRTMNELRKIANTVFKCVQFTTDCPSNHVERKVSVLDLQLYVGDDGLVKHEFYEKPCASKFAIPSQSAHSKRIKMSVIVEEGLRRLRNCSRGLESDVRRRVMERWARKLQRSGYLASVRHQLISEAVAKYKKMCKTEDEGGRPIHRAKEWQKAARRLKRRGSPPPGTKTARRGSQHL